MAKTKTTFYCQNCGTNSPKWIGKCPSCGEWNTYLEEVEIKGSTDQTAELWKKTKTSYKSIPTPIHEIVREKLQRFSSENEELDRVLGGGVVPGSLILIGGEPGIGKSTLMLQVGIQLAEYRILYVSGEESLQQIKMRADRIGISSEQCFLLSETSLEEVFHQIAGLEPQMVIVDSIQTIHTSKLEAVPGSVSQVRECAGQLMRYAKETSTPVFLIGHITKEGSIAGPKVLEHMVDTVLQFEGDRHHEYRILRTIKNRFGPTSELGIFKMYSNGLTQIKNPSEILLSQHQGDRSGVAIGASIEGNRPLLIEVQALVSPATYSSPQRSTTGFDIKRLHMLLAVLEKRLGLRLGTQDVYLNITGGIRINDPSLDLAVCVAVYSSYNDTIISKDSCFIGEVGLGGEIRRVNRIENRIKEAEKLGFSETYLSGNNEEISGMKTKLKTVKSLKEVFESLLG